MLETRDLSVRFGGHKAVNRVSCQFQPGTLTAIVGPNGAGKTTYFNLISGQIAATQGQVWLDGQNLSAWPAARRTRAGLGRAFQLTQLFPRLSVLENVRLAVQAMQPGRHWRGLHLFSVSNDHPNLQTRAYELLHSVAMAHQAHTPVASLPHGDQRKLEVAMLLALEPRVYMFDEPTAGMAPKERVALMELAARLARSQQIAVLFTEHDMDVVFSQADRIIVLDRGRLIAGGTPAEVRADPDVRAVYLGSGH